jgi:hypothetical protein
MLNLKLAVYELLGMTNEVKIENRSAKIENEYRCLRSEA